MSEILARESLSRIEDYQVETVPDADIVVNANETNWDMTPEIRLAGPGSGLGGPGTGIGTCRRGSSPRADTGGSEGLS